MEMEAALHGISFPLRKIQAWFCRKTHFISFKYQLYTKHYLMAEETEPRTPNQGEICWSCYFTHLHNGKQKNVKTTKLKLGYELPWSLRSLQLGGSTKPRPASSSFVSHTIFRGVVQAICHFRDLIINTGPCVIAWIEHSDRKIYGYTHTSCVAVDGCDYMCQHSCIFFF